MKSAFNVTVEEAFAVGRLEGMKEAFREMVEAGVCDPLFLSYVKGRVKSLEENIKYFNAIKKGSKTNTSKKGQ